MKMRKSSGLTTKRRRRLKRDPPGHARKPGNPGYITQEVSLRLSLPERGHLPDLYGPAAIFGRGEESGAQFMA